MRAGCCRRGRPTVVVKVHGTVTLLPGLATGSTANSLPRFFFAPRAAPLFAATAFRFFTLFLGDEAAGSEPLSQPTAVVSSSPAYEIM
jgi:hypothetical protein